MLPPLYIPSFTPDHHGRRHKGQWLCSPPQSPTHPCTPRAISSAPTYNTRTLARRIDKLPSNNPVAPGSGNLDRGATWDIQSSEANFIRGFAGQAAVGVGVCGRLEMGEGPSHPYALLAEAVRPSRSTKRKPCSSAGGSAVDEHQLRVSCEDSSLRKMDRKMSSLLEPPSSERPNTTTIWKYADNVFRWAAVAASVAPTARPVTVSTTARGYIAAATAAPLPDNTMHHRHGRRTGDVVGWYTRSICSAGSGVSNPPRHVISTLCHGQFGESIETTNCCHTYGEGGSVEDQSLAVLRSLVSTCNVRHNVCYGSSVRRQRWLLRPQYRGMGTDTLASNHTVLPIVNNRGEDGHDNNDDGGDGAERLCVEMGYRRQFSRDIMKEGDDSMMCFGACRLLMDERSFYVHY